MVHYKPFIIDEQYEMSKIGQLMLDKQEQENNEYHHTGRYSTAVRQPLREGTEAPQGREESCRNYEDWVEFCDRSDYGNSEASNWSVESVDCKSSIEA
tara:strand:+ start:1287 stop:1580 length:294 start_codon:yes stop_codon:yes gene_type:complete